MKRRLFFIEHVLQLLLLARIFYIQLIEVPIFVAAFTILLALKYHVEGFTPLTLLLVLFFIGEVIAEGIQSKIVQYIASLAGGLLYFVPLKLYWLPEPSKMVGFRQDYIEGYHYFQFYPLDNSKEISLKSMKWSYAKEISKMIEYRDYSHKLIKKIAQLILSYATKHQLKVGEGTEKETKSSIAISHGKGGTPLFYSSLMMHFAGQQFRVGGVQHSEKMRISMNDKKQIKQYREKQVVVRAQQLIKAIQKLKNERIVLMGHSYGSATVLQAYYMLDEVLKAKVTHIILLDPWLFPLTDQVFNQKLKIPVLILANQDFVGNQDAYLRNNKFISKHSVEYIIWQGAHHLHQTDVGFINGNLLGTVKNSSLSRQKLQLNIEAIDLFLGGQKVEGRFGEKDVGRDYKPTTFYVENLAVW